MTPPTIPPPNMYTIVLLDGEEKTVQAHSFTTGDGYHTLSTYVDTSNGVAVETVFRIGCGLVKYVEAVIASRSGRNPKIPIETLDLDVRAYNTLKREEIVTIGDLFWFITSRRASMHKGFGEKSRESVVSALSKAGYLVKEEEDE